MSDHSNYFEEPAKHKLAKARIASKYFGGWARIIGARRETITYLDLCSGPGRFENNEPSTPVMILDQLNGLPEAIKVKTKLIFYEADPIFYEKLRENVFSHPVCAQLPHEPLINNRRVDDSLLRELELGPGVFSFVDPFSYREISYKLLSAMIDNWGSDCLFYLSTSGIKRNLKHESEETRLERIFGKERLLAIRRSFREIRSPREREKYMLQQLDERLNESRPVYFLDFAVEFEQRRANSHYLIFLSKNVLGFALIKDIMAKESLRDSEDVPVYMYRSIALQNADQADLRLSERMAMLERQLVLDFGGQEWTVGKLIRDCHLRRYKYPGPTIKNALNNLEEKGKLTVDLPRDTRTRAQKVTLGDRRIVRFR